MSKPFKEAVVHLLLKRPSLDTILLDGFHPISNLPFLGKVAEKMVAQQLQSFLDEMNYLDPLQSGFRLGYGHTFDHSGRSRMEVVHTSLHYLIAQ